jgi:glycosyltransferase involved in cell wall biosynthesis
MNRFAMLDFRIGEAERLVNRIRVSMFMRRPQPGNHSVERLFAAVRAHLPPDVACEMHVCSRESLGLWRRLWITIEAAFRQADVNHVTGDVQFLTALMNRRRTILTVLDLTHVERMKGLRRWLFLLIWYRIPIARAQAVTVISAVTRDHLLHTLGPLRAEVRVIHCCLIDGLGPSPKPFNSAKPVILFVGLAENKNFHRAVAALAGLPCDLRIIGKLQDEHRASLATHGVAFTSASGLSDAAMRDEYANCDILVFASTAEGFGMPILEAQAVGRPVVTSGISSMPEVAGDAAELVDPFDIASIRAGVRRVIEDASHREALIARGFQNVRRFTPQAIAAQYATLYREVAESSRRAHEGSTLSL